MDRKSVPDKSFLQTHCLSRTRKVPMIAFKFAFDSFAMDKVPHLLRSVSHVLLYLFREVE